MRVSVIIRSKDEAPRLRLTLTSMAIQTVRPQVVVVNDGSRDDTRAVIESARDELDLAVVHHDAAKGRSAAANAGAAVADGDILLFLDGDTLGAPDLVERHLEAHGEGARRVVRGETWHVRCTRVFLDPESGAPMPGCEDQVARMSPRDRARARVTRQQVRTAFTTIQDRAQPGVYPGFGPRALFDLEMLALRAGREPQLLWTAASGSNQSVSRQAFLDSGGFHPALTINEHRELALRLCQAGLSMAATTGRTFHLIHRSGWRDPLVEADWEKTFYATHPTPEVALMSVLWASLSDRVAFPDAARILDLESLARAAQRCRGVVGADAVRAAHFAHAAGRNA